MNYVARYVTAKPENFAVCAACSRVSREQAKRKIRRRGALKLTQTAGDIENLAGNPARVVAEQKRGGVGDLFGRAQTI